jgi:hypothetical protein
MAPLSDFRFTRGFFSFPGTRHLDYAKINELPDDAFLSVHQQLMEEYRHNGWWTIPNIPGCQRCHEPIAGPESLIRYFGQSYDPPCFREVWTDERKSESKRNPDFGAYLDRLVSLLVDNGR